ncbi:MAG: transglycosylase SLT domain-containing protein [Spirochaetales bacterium]|nr:transglycosylase SLT domain-containing protein [Spirochaetales bacterium]
MIIYTMLRFLPLVFVPQGEDILAKGEESTVLETQWEQDRTAAPESLNIAGEGEPTAPEEEPYAIPDNVPEEIELLLIKYSARYGLPLDVVVRLSEVESNHGEYARSIHTNFDGSFDIGILALNSNFIDYFGERYFEGDPSQFDPYNPEHNIQTGLAYLAHLNSLTEGDLTSAVAAYNCGYRSMLSGKIPHSTHRYVRAVIDGESL